MKRASLVKRAIVWAALAPACAISFTAVAAEWNKCAGCHNGKTAPDKAALLQKHKTADSFVSAAKTSKSPMMKSFQKNDAALKGAAADLGLK
jgi:hypothetical protein